MILTLEPNTTLQEAQKLMQRLKKMGFKTLCHEKDDAVIIVIVDGVDAHTQPELFTKLPHVARVAHFSEPFKLAGHDLHTTRKVIAFENAAIGADSLTVMAGPCAIESESQIHKIAQQVAAAGAKFLRGGAFKPRTSPYTFQGLGEQGLKFMHAAARANNLYCISEVMDLAQLEVAVDTLDILQVGARNMYNYTLLKALGKVGKPILLKRGLSATYKEFLMAAEYILNAGNPDVILCERGIRTFENHTRNTLDLNAVPVLKKLSHLPIIVDPSHGTGIRTMVAPLSRAAIAVGADGLIIETHYDPDNALSDSQQTLHTDDFTALMPTLQQIHHLIHDDKNAHSMLK